MTLEILHRLNHICEGRWKKRYMDLGRHILAKGFGKPVTEYKEISKELHREGILRATEAELMRELAGYRSRMVHFYNEITTEVNIRVGS